MKNKGFSLAVTVLATPLLAHSLTAPTAAVAGFCGSSASSVATTVIAIVYLALTGQPFPC